MRKLALFVLIFGVLISPLVGAEYLVYSIGEGVTSEFIFINPTDTPIQIVVDFYDQEKTPVEVSLEEYGEFSSFWVSLAPWEVWKCQTAESIELQSGYMKADLIFKKGIVLVNINHNGIKLSEQIKQGMEEVTIITRGRKKK